MPHPLLRWLLYGWMMVLVDLLVEHGGGFVGRLRRQDSSAAALVAAQIGLAIIWERWNGPLAGSC
jgi:hypothetical protein